MEEDRHLSMAEIPSWGSPDVLIVESTFGAQTLPSKYFYYYFKCIKYIKCIKIFNFNII